MKKLLNKLRLKLSLLKFYIGVSVAGADKIFKSEDHSVSEKDKKSTRKIHSNETLEKFYAGKTDEKYTQQYYEILKKADLFMKRATPYKMAAVADRFGMSLGREIIKGEKVEEHFGFYDEKHVNVGKTLLDVIDKEIEERRTKDDELKVIDMVDNKAIQPTISDSIEYALMSNIERVKLLKYPIKLVRENDESISNKLEMITEYMHVKRIDDTHSQLEFFVDKKFKLDKIETENKIFQELINFKQVQYNGKYDDKYIFNVLKFSKRYNHNDRYEVLKFFVQNVEIIK